MAFNLYAGNYKRLLAMPIILTFVLAYVAFFAPGLTEGIDISGGTLLIIQTDQKFDAPRLERTLNDRFDLEDLKVTVTGFGLRVQYADSVSIAAAKDLIVTANQKIDSDPVTAKQTAQAAVQAASRYLTPVPDLSALEPRDAVSSAQGAVLSAEENFNNQLSQTIFSELGIPPDQSKVQRKQIGSALGKTFWQNALWVTLIGVLGILVVVFIFFREFVPTISIVYSGIFDILAGLAFMALLQIPLSLATIPALLMVTGYSIDTDILLTTRILRKKGGTDKDRGWDSFITGLTMTLTALAAVGVMMVLAFSTGISVIYEIGAVLVGGLIGDLIVTWFGNAPIVLWYSETKAKKGGD
jgi:preprotein translocase subunit SecF